jgi:HK97 family phage prohead protease
MANEREQRTFEVSGLEVRGLEDGQQPVITGYAVVFDSWSEVMTDNRGRPFRERFAPGAFDRALAAGPDIRALWNHNDDYPLGRVRNGTLQVSQDGSGVRFELQPPDTSWGRDAVASIRRGDVSGVSFAFSAKRDGGDTWEKPGPDGVAQRTVLDASLYEVSPVTFPAYAATSVGVRSVSVPDFDESDGRAAGEIDDAQAGRAAVQAQERERRLRLLDLNLRVKG